MRHRLILIDAEPADIKQMSAVIGSAFPQCKLEIFHDGANALQFFHEYQTGHDRTDISLAVLNLKLPRFGGHDLLRHIRSKDITRRIPLIVLTENTDPKEAEQAYGLGATNVIVKSDGYLDSLRTIIYSVLTSA